MSFKSISYSQHEAFLSALKAGQYNLLLGAGSSMDSTNAFGKIPSGDDLKKQLAALKKVGSNYTLQKVFSLLDEKEIEINITRRFSGCKPGPTPENIIRFLWKRIFTWNIDDVLENAYNLQIPKQNILPIHYNDEYIEAQSSSELLLVHLHGTVKHPEKGYVFSRDQYVNQIVKINPWMTVLSQFMQSEPMIIAGTSLDEIDLDYYLAQRSNVTSRDDRGPSILVSSEDDAVSEDICRKHNLVQFVGWASHFFDYCKNILPNPPTPEDLIPIESRRLLPATVGKAKALSFFSDFEIVPASSSRLQNSRFLYGHSPTWSDLESNMDISRSVSADLIVDIEKRLADPAEPTRLLLMAEAAGVGKTTILRRVAFELSKRGVRTLICSALSRIDGSTASIIDEIEEPILIVVDNFADQATAIGELITNLRNANVVILASERGYRLNYLKQVLSGIPVLQKNVPSLSEVEIVRLIDKFVSEALVGDHAVITRKKQFAGRLTGDPIAIACCRIMNDFRPLDRIIDETFEIAHIDDLTRYLCASLAEHCFKGGVRFEVLLGCANPRGIRAQFDGQHPLPLSYFDADRDFVIPENATLGERLLAKAVKDERELLLKIFINLALELRPRVNRGAIKRRTPEARLAGRLFDYDDVVEKMLGDRAENFYQSTKESWQWNSRYWEQVALLKLGKYRKAARSTEGLLWLAEAVQNARFAVSIEHHPFGLTTLGKILMTQMSAEPSMQVALYDEAFNKLFEAIQLEGRRSRSAIQPYSSLLSGTHSYLEVGGVLNRMQIERVNTLFPPAIRRFSRDAEFARSASELMEKLKNL